MISLLLELLTELSRTCLSKWWHVASGPLPSPNSCVWSLLNKVCNSNGPLAGRPPIMQMPMERKRQKQTTPTIFPEDSPFTVSKANKQRKIQTAEKIFNCCSPVKEMHARVNFCFQSMQSPCQAIWNQCKDFGSIWTLNLVFFRTAAAKILF